MKQVDVESKELAGEGCQVCGCPATNIAGSAYVKRLYYFCKQHYDLAQLHRNKKEVWQYE